MAIEINSNYSNAKYYFETKETLEVVEKIRSVESRWLSDKEAEMKRLASFCFTHSAGSLLQGSLILPVLHALELEQVFETTHHVFVYSQSFAEGLITMLIKSIQTKKSKQDLPYREEFRLERDLDPPDIMKEKIRRSGEELVKYGERMIKGASGLRNIVNDFSEDKLISLRLDIYVNIFLKSSVEQYDSANQLLPVARLSNPSSLNNFIFSRKSSEKAEDLLTNSLKVWDTEVYVKLDSLFNSIFEARDVNFNTGMLNVILIPKKSASNMFYSFAENASEASLYMREMAKNPEIFTIRLVNDDKAFMDGIKQQLNDLNIPQYRFTESSD